MSENAQANVNVNATVQNAESVDALQAKLDKLLETANKVSSRMGKLATPSVAMAAAAGSAAGSSAADFQAVSTSMQELLGAQGTFAQVRGQVMRSTATTRADTSERTSAARVRSAEARAKEAQDVGQARVDSARGVNAALEARQQAAFDHQEKMAAAKAAQIRAQAFVRADAQDEIAAKRKADKEAAAAAARKKATEKGSGQDGPMAWAKKQRTDWLQLQNDRLTPDKAAAEAAYEAKMAPMRQWGSGALNAYAWGGPAGFGRYAVGSGVKGIAEGAARGLSGAGGVGGVVAGAAGAAALLYGGSQYYAYNKLNENGSRLAGMERAYRGAGALGVVGAGEGIKDYLQGPVDQQLARYASPEEAIGLTMSFANRRGGGRRMTHADKEGLTFAVSRGLSAELPASIESIRRRQRDKGAFGSKEYMATMEAAGIRGSYDMGHAVSSAVGLGETARSFGQSFDFEQHAAAVASIGRTVKDPTRGVDIAQNLGQAGTKYASDFQSSMKALADAKVMVASAQKGGNIAEIFGRIPGMSAVEKADAIRGDESGQWSMFGMTGNWKEAGDLNKKGVEGMGVGQNKDLYALARATTTEAVEDQGTARQQAQADRWGLQEAANNVELARAAMRLRGSFEALEQQVVNMIGKFGIAAAGGHG